MPYFGVVSKGCQRCRQRKIKCDQRKPGCSRCQKSGAQCTGYRNLDDVVFRDESQRIIRIARKDEQLSSSLLPKSQVSKPATLEMTKGVVDPLTFGSMAFIPSSSFAVRISSPLLQSPNELGANFFFAKYVFNGHPFAISHRNWLAKCYLQDCPGPLGAAIEAAGMAGISNISDSLHLAYKSKERYRDAVAAAKQALDDPAQAADDVTLMAVILLGLYETVSFETWDRYRDWATHVQGATALVELRGHEQFTRERGAQLYIQIRSQILLACMEQHVCVPPALVTATFNFQSSGIRERWQQRKAASPASICEISFRVVNLWAAFKSETATDPQAIRARALEIDGDLKAWGQSLPSYWKYATVDDGERAAEASFGRIRHEYPGLWVANVWNNWRTLRIVIGHILIHNETRSVRPDSALEAFALSIIHQMSVDICVSTSSFNGDSLVLSLIPPLHAIAAEEMVSWNVRAFAVDCLRGIGASAGVRMAVLVADAIAKRLHEPCPV